MTDIELFQFLLYQFQSGLTVSHVSWLQYALPVCRSVLDNGYSSKPCRRNMGQQFLAAERRQLLRESANSTMVPYGSPKFQLRPSGRPII